MSDDKREKPQRFQIEAFESYLDCQDFLNTLDDDQIVVGFTDTNRCVTVCVERLPSQEHGR